MRKLLLIVMSAILLPACSGMRTTGETFTTHAENFNFLFMQFPGGDTQERAMEMVPVGGEVETLISTPNDVTSIIGFFSRLIGIDYTTVNGTIKQ
jgi:hypothetical protein